MGNDNEVSKRDQFVEILKRFKGLNFDQDFSFLRNTDQELYTKEIHGVSKSSNLPDLAESFPNCPAQFKNILNLML